MQRLFTEPAPLVLTTSASTTPNLDMRNSAGGRVIVPAGSTGLTTLTWYELDANDSPVPCYDESAGAVTQTVDGTSGGSYPIPPSLGGGGTLRITGNVAATIKVVRKS